MSIYYEYSSSMQATLMRFVVCEECDSEFVYEIDIEGYGLTTSSIFYTGSAPEKAKKQARDEFNDQKKFKCRALPCPKCLHFQDHMIKQAKRDRTAMFFIMGILILIAFTILGFGIRSFAHYNTIANIFFILAFVLGGGSCLVGLILYSIYDPNSLSEEKRLQMAQGESILRTEFEESFQKKNEAEFVKICRKIDQGKTTKLKIEGEFFADWDQIDQECRLKAILPSGEPIRIQLKHNMKKGTRFRYEHDYKGLTIDFDYKLFVYSEVKSR